MGAFIVAGLISLATLALCAIGLFAGGMSVSPERADEIYSQVAWIFWIGGVLAGLVLASHWLPHIGW